MFFLPTEKELTIVLDETQKHNMLGMVRDLMALPTDEERAELLGVSLLCLNQLFTEIGKDEAKEMLVKLRDEVGARSPYAEGLTLALSVLK